MNVMKKAHEMTKRAIALAVGKVYTYAQMFRIALKQAHKEFKAMMNKPATEVVNTHQLNNGDKVKHYGCTLELTNKRLSNCHKDSEVYVFDTVCIHREVDATMPEHWTTQEGGFKIQGNENARWNKVV